MVPTNFSATSSTTVDSGQTINVTWTVLNQGSGPAQQPWTDRVYLSPDNVFGNGNDAFLTQVTHTANLAPGASYVEPEVLTIPAGQATGTYFLFLQADGLSNQVEENEANNVFTPPIQITVTLRRPDFVPTAFTATSSTTVDSGGTINVGWTIANQSASAATAVQPWTDRVFLSPDNVFGNGNDAFLTQVTHTANLAAGASYTEPEVLTIPAGQATGMYFLFLQADGLSNQTEENENNNVFTPPIQITVTLRRPDLVPTAFTATSSTTVDSGQTINVEWTIANQTASAATAVQPWTDRVFLSPDNVFGNGNDAFLTQVTHTANLAPGASYVEPEVLTIPAGQATGTYFLFLQADGLSNQVEENEANNVFTPPIQITVTLRRPDLVPTAFTATSSTTVDSGGTINVEWTIANQSASAATAVQPWTDRVYLSPDNVFGNGNDAFLTQVTHTANLAPGASYTEPEVLTIPAGQATGTYFLFLQADGLSNQTEENENNNVFTPPIQITVTLRRPDLVPTAFTATSSTTVARGGTLNVEWTIANQSVSAATAVQPWTDRVYLSPDNVFGNGNDASLTQVTHTANLAPGASYTEPEALTIPAGQATGTYFLFLQTDGFSNQTEENENNNVFTPPIQIAVTP